MARMLSKAVEWRFRAAGLCLWGLGVAAASGATPTTTTSLVFLPGAGGGNATAAAAALADLLAAGLQDDPSIRIISRLQLQRVLDEWTLTASRAGQLFAFDTMVRVVVKPSPQQGFTAALRVVDLSMGNEAASGSFAWNPDGGDAQLAPMVALCRKGARTARAANAGKVKVRYLGVRLPQRMVRRRPVAARLTKVLGRRVETLGDVVIVRHLEAASPMGAPSCPIRMPPSNWTSRKSIPGARRSVRHR